MFSAVYDIIKRRDLLVILVGRNLKIRYKNSALGFFWSLLVPIFMIGIYALFLKLMRFTVDLPMLVTGIIAWQFLAMSLGDSLYAIVGNANLVTKSAFPRIMLPLSMVCANVVNFLLSGIVLIVYLLIAQADLHHAYWVPVVILTQIVLVLGVSLLFATANVFFRDTEHMVSMVLLTWFFLSPVIYSHDMVVAHESLAPEIKALFFFNPMTGIITGYRMALLGWEGPGCANLMLSLVSAVVICLLGWYVFTSQQSRFGDEL